jgi:drug/metabolite transporter (DMT)-like permease
MTIVALLVSCVFAAIGQLLFKWGSAGNRTLLAFANPYVVGGFVFYGVSTVLWLYALTTQKLSVVFPFTALTFILVYGVSYFVLDEKLGGRELFGAILVLCGLFLVVWRSL